ncbi:DUF6702 family protein [Ichthyobacterium seriolicida]|uniref:Peptidase E n=1 Tax=Ichthyobacterium seriolicida TaxID=242600 RepID=A0A1J1DVX9_9FLAO|nr:DUF6702 family protein [Ichthyobacterium seriolicida]BAV94017.1 hypothetical protein JBKA6_0004 [Ichthyobacterium seriolicida]
MNTKLKSAIILLSCLFCLGFYKHKFYVSITDINYDSDLKYLEVSIKVFTDDLENSLNAYFPSEDIRLNLGIGQKNEKEIFTTYLNSCFSIGINDKKKESEYIGRETTTETTTCYIAVNEVFLEEIDRIKVHQSILNNFLDKQQNIVNIVLGKHRKTLLLNKQKSEEVFVIDKT